MRHPFNTGDTLRTGGRFHGFTLIESLIALTATGVLAAVCLGAAQNVLKSASMTREISAARQLVTALHASTQDLNGAYLPGMDYRAGTDAYPVYNTKGQKVTGRPAQRYTFRLAPYFGNRFDGTILVNKNKTDSVAYSKGNAFLYDYYLSSYPALGMNIYCVGGIINSNGSLLNSDDCISHTTNTVGSILAFASGGAGVGEGKVYGYSFVAPPTLAHDSPNCLQWQPPGAWSDKADPMNYGWVDFRYDGKAVCAFLDGSVRMCSVEELSDMRLWTKSAKEADDPNYQMTITP